MSKSMVENRNGAMVDFDSAFELMDENIRKDEEAKEFYNNCNWIGSKEIKAKIKVLAVNDISGGEGVLELKK